MSNDELIAVVNSPDLERGVVFGDGGRRLVRVNDNAEERFYVVADLASVGFVDGDTLRTSVEIVARDDKTDPGEISFGDRDAHAGRRVQSACGEGAPADAYHRVGLRS
jgi:hypothetical protein